MRKRALLGLSCLLAACGGGGSSGGGWLTFSPSQLQGVTYEGEPALNLQLRAISSRTISEQLYVGVVLDGTVFSSVMTQPVSDRELDAQLTVMAILPVGVNQGNLEVRICRDDPTVCEQPYDGSPWHVPYQIEVRSSAGLSTAVQNGDFSAGATGWGAWANQGSMSASVTGGVLKATITSAGPDASSMGISYGGGINVESGKAYRLSFDAKADSSRTMVAMVTENGRDLNGNGFPYDDYIIPGPIPSLTTTMTSYHYDFAAPITNRDAGVVFYLGGSSANVYLDNVSVTELPPS